MGEMPLPLVVAFSVLIGYPLVQAAALWFGVRPRARRADAIVYALKSDPRYENEGDQRAISAMRQQGAPPAGTDWLILAAPIAAPLIVVGMAVAELVGKGPLNVKLQVRAELTRVHLWKQLLEEEIDYPPDGDLWADDRFTELAAASSDEVTLRWPISTVLTALGMILTSPIWACAFGLRWSTLKGFRSMGLVVASFARLLPLVGPRGRHSPF